MAARHFTFATNRTRFLRIPAYAAAAVISLTFPRDRDLWVFGRRNGVGEGPLAVLEAARQQDLGLRLVWIAQDEEQRREAEALGIEVHPARHWRAWWSTLRAGVLVLSYGPGDVCRAFAPGAHIVQTWHGAPLKRIRLDSPISLANVPGGRLGARIFTFAVTLSGRWVRTVPVASRLVGDRFRSALGWSDSSRLAYIGDPRCDALLAGDPVATRRRAREKLASLWGCPPEDLPDHLALYAPTWRDGDEGPTLSGDDFTLQWRSRFRELGCWLVVRSHPWGSVGGDVADEAGESPVRFASSSLVNDLNSVLPAFDVLISDYSAVAIDYSVLDRPQLFYAPDAAEYVRDRGLYEPYELFTGGVDRRTWGEVFEQLAALLSDPVAAEQNLDLTSRQIRRRYHEIADGEAAARLVTLVRERVGT